MIQIAPSILSADFMNLERDILHVIEAGADVLHVDVMDGHYVPNLTIGPPVIQSIKSKVDIPLDVHIMIEHPDDWIERYVQAGANELTFHVEAARDVEQCIQHIHEHGAQAGLSLNPKTPIERIFPYLQNLDLVLIMSVEPGFGGQSFIESTYDKITALKNALSRQNTDCIISVDGGVNATNAAQLQKAGVNRLVAGSAIFKAKAYFEAIQALRQ